MGLETTISTIKKAVKNSLLSLAAISAMSGFLKGAPTVDFYDDNGLVRFNATNGKYVLDMSVKNQPPFPRLPVRPPALPTAFTPKAIS